MIVSTTNIAKDAALTFSPESELVDPDVITDGDYSSVYRDTLSNKLTITFEFAIPTDVGYIAIGGSNISRKDRIVVTGEGEGPAIELFSSDQGALFSSDGEQLFASYENQVDDSDLMLNESRVIMYQADIMQANRVVIEIYGSGQIQIAEIAMGDYYEIPNNGEQAGYRRPWTVPNIKARSAVGLQNSPINLSYESRGLSVTLKVPNNLMRDFDEWYNFMSFASSNTFYVLEDEDKFHSYAGFNAVPDTTNAHSQTRKLGDSGIQFNAFARSSEALF